MSNLTKANEAVVLQYLNGLTQGVVVSSRL